MKRSALSATLVAALLTSPGLVLAEPSPSASSIERGRHLIKLAGCNDCHTAGYGPAGGQVPEKDWLQGDVLGWQGPWGTTYATNLRLHFNQLTAAQWIHQARTMKSRPPMPWFVFREMSDADLRAIHAYLRHAGPAGQAAPAYAPPGQPASGPVVRFPQ